MKYRVQEAWLREKISGPNLLPNKRSDITFEIRGRDADIALAKAYFSSLDGRYVFAELEPGVLTAGHPTLGIESCRDEHDSIMLYLFEHIQHSTITSLLTESDNVEKCLHTREPLSVETKLTHAVAQASEGRDFDKREDRKNAIKEVFLYMQWKPDDIVEVDGVEATAKEVVLGSLRAMRA